MKSAKQNRFFIFENNFGGFDVFIEWAKGGVDHVRGGLSWDKATELSEFLTENHINPSCINEVYNSVLGHIIKLGE